MTFGKYSYGFHHVKKWSNDDADLFVGKFTSIAADVTMYLDNGNGHDATFISTYPFGQLYTDRFPNVVNKSRNSNGNIVIGSDVWIGENVVIMSGVTIGHGAIIANNSHVVKNVQPYSIVGGNPAKHIKYRFTKEQIEKLLQIQWWNWTDDKINEKMQFICSPNIDEFISACSNEQI